MFFLSNMYRYLKLGIASLCILFGIIIIFYGITDSSNIAFIVGGIVMLLAGLFLIMDGSKVLADIRDEVGHLKNERAEFDRANKDLQINNQEYDQNLKDNQVLLESQKKIIKRYESNLEDLKRTTKEQQSQLDKASANLDKLEREVDQSQKNNKQLSDQIVRFQSLNRNLKTVILTMAESLDKSNELSNALNASITKIENASHDILQSANLMEKLTTNISHLKFKDLDVNGDGVISIDEWKNL